MYLSFIDGGYANPLYLMLYESFIVVTIFWCTLSIIYRILSVGQASHNGTDGRFGAYYYVIRVLVESSALYSITLILNVAFNAHNGSFAIYTDSIGAIARVCSYSISILLI